MNAEEVITNIAEWIRANPEAIKRWTKENTLTFRTDFGVVSMVKDPFVPDSNRAAMSRKDPVPSEVDPDTWKFLFPDLNEVDTSSAPRIRSKEMFDSFGDYWEQDNIERYGPPPY